MQTGYFVITLQRQFEKEMTPVSANINMLSTAQEIAKKYNKRKPMQLARIWITLNYVNKKNNGNFTYKYLTELTKLSANTIKEYRDILIKENVLNISYRVEEDEDTKEKICLGQTVYMNELKEENKIEHEAEDLLKHYN